MAVEKLVMDEELAQLWALRRFEIERDRLRKELEERDVELSRVWESKNKDADLELVLRRLKESNYQICS